ncbi:DUF3068 domain-containing protein [Streptomyces sp. NPDC058274]|uniref:DUF3068 domain-containing protein n=1 Tax=Streptomyces sp. NPDC058274 TaxID=3346416 RepID=UPI0036E5ACF7
MRRLSPVALSCLGAGVFLLVLAPMLAWYVTPRAEAAPLDIDETSVVTGTGDYFDLQRGVVQHDQKITVTRHVRGNVAAGSDDTAVWDMSTTIDTPSTLKLRDPRRSFSWTVERWVSDRHTAEPVHCCGESTTSKNGEPLGGRYEGEGYLKFPFHVQPRTYRWWDGSLQGTYSMHYAGPAEVHGYPGLKFTGRIPPTKIDSRLVPGALVGLPGTPQVKADVYYGNSDIEYVVDQRTGRFLSAKSSPRQTLRRPGSTTDALVLLSVPQGLAMGPADQAANVAGARRDNARLRLLGVTVPMGAAAAGLLLAAVGAFRLARPSRRGHREEATATA